uniref:Conserved oligomeric Golgi complex subunit 3 n=1 Tax=Astyanax mexicanus TaxID=7994 RepID=A0A8B9GT89_ASTMX
MVPRVLVLLQLPIEDLCSLPSRSLFPAAIPASTEDVLLKGFQMLDMEDRRIETAQQFFSWFSKLQAQMDQDEGAKYRCVTRECLSCYQDQCDAILTDVSAALEHLDSLQKQYLFVSTKTGTLHEACEQLLKEQVCVCCYCSVVLFKAPELFLHVSPVLFSQVRSGCAFMAHVCQDENQLYSEFFSKPTAKVDELLEKLCLSLYDVLRPLIIHVVHLETLSELCGILKNEMLEDHVHNNAVQLGAFEAVVKQMLEDVQERLVYRTHIYIQTDISGYSPAPGDLAYPEKLQMMEKIAQSLKEEQLRLNSPDSSFSDVQLEDPESRKLISSGGVESSRVPASVSPADLHGMWYPTVRRTLVCLSKLYRCIDRAVFQGLSQEALSACIQSLLKASEDILKNKSQIDGQLFLIKHLLILREQIAPFHADFAIKEISLDLKKTRGGCLLEFLLEGTPEIKEHYIDSKKDVDRHLKSSCEHFIQQQTRMFVGSLEEFLTKVAALKTMAIQGGPTYNLSQQPWAQPAKINDLVMSMYRVMKNKVPGTLQSMSLYLANKDTEFILFKPVRNNIQQVFQKLHNVLQEEYSGEDLQIIACPSMEQVSVVEQHFGQFSLVV